MQIKREWCNPPDKVTVDFKDGKQDSSVIVQQCGVTVKYKMYAEGYQAGGMDLTYNQAKALYNGFKALFGEDIQNGKD